MRKRYKAKSLVGLAIIALLSAFAAGCGGSDSGKPATSVVYGGQTIIPDLVFRGKDWGEKHDVKIKHVRFPSGGEAFEAVLSGEVNVSNGGSGRLITIAAQRPEAISIIAKWQYGGGRYSILTPPGSPIKSPADLKGKTLAVDTGSGAFTLLQVWFEQNGLAPADVKVIQTKVGDIGAALTSGSADVGVAWEPTASLLVEKKVATRFATLEKAGESPNFLIVNRKWAEANRELLVAFLRSAVDVGKFILDDPDAAGAMAAKVNSEEGVDASATALAESLRRIEMAPKVDEKSLAELTSLAEELKAQQKIPRVPDFHPMVDDSYLKEALGQ